MHVNGGREDNNNYLIDGITVADYAFGELTYTPLPSPDAVEEFKVSTSLYDATQGRNGGGNINATLKSGTTKFHGDLWEYFRNTDLDATDYFLGKVQIKQNIFGGDFGGPIGPKAKLGFFYVNVSGHAPAQRRFAGNIHQQPERSRSSHRARPDHAAQYLLLRRSLRRKYGNVYRSGRAGVAERAGRPVRSGRRWGLAVPQRSSARLDLPMVNSIRVRWC